MKTRAVWEFLETSFHASMTTFAIIFGLKSVIFFYMLAFAVKNAAFSSTLGFHDFALNSTCRRWGTRKKKSQYFTVQRSRYAISEVWKWKRNELLSNLYPTNRKVTKKKNKKK